MSQLSRVSISLENTLLEQFDKLNEGKGYATRSEAIRDLIREKLIHNELTTGKGVQVAVVSLVYDHHSRELARKLMDKQHHHHDQTVATTHVHIDEHNCLEVTILRGPGPEIRRLGEELISTKGVLHGQISFAAGQALLEKLGAAHFSAEEESHSHAGGKTHSHRH